MKGYISGKRERNGEVTISVDGRRLDPGPSLQIRNHSPTGFDWGYSGSGPAQTSLAVLLDLGVSKEDAEKHYQDFKSEFIATQPRHVLHVPISHVHPWAQERGLNIRPWGRLAEARRWAQERRLNIRPGGSARRGARREETTMAKPDRHQEHAERYHKEFAGQLIEQIKKGTAPWQKPWKPGERIAQRNLASGRPYSGSNTVRLMAVAADKGYSDSRWATYSQIEAAGGQVRKGERGTRVLSFKTHRRVAVKDEKGKPVKDKKGEQVYRHEKLARPFSRVYTVFNVEQARGIQPEPKPEPGKTWEAHKRAEEVIKASGVPVKHVQGDRAYYSLSSDQVVLPEKVQFPSADHYYQTAMHELGHASGHPDRLNRDTLQQGMNDGFGSENYAREELRAEISAMMTGDRLGTGHDPSRGAAYVSSWVEVLDKNPQEIITASAEAQRMSNYLISRTQERQQDQPDRTDKPNGQGKDRAEAAVPPREPAAPREPDSPTHKHQDDHRGAWAGRPKEPGREYHVVRHSYPKAPGVRARPAVYTIEDTKEPDRLVPHRYGGKYGTQAEAEQAKERLVQEQNQGGRWPDDYVRAQRLVPLEVAATPGTGGKAGMMVHPSEAEAVKRLRSAGIRCEPGARSGWDCTEASRNERLGTFSSPQAAEKSLLGDRHQAVTRGAGRPGVHQDQFPTRGAPER